MSTTNRAWMAVVVAALLLGALVGVAWALPNGSPKSAEITRKITLTGADFMPAAEYFDYNNNASAVSCASSTCTFFTAVDFPTLSSVTVERIKLHVKDDNGTNISNVGLYRVNPPAGTSTFLGVAGSPIGTSGGLQTYASVAIDKVFWPSQRAILSVYVGGTNITVYGVTVEYHRNS